MRVVLDTNVVARSLGPSAGPAAELFQRIATGHALVVSRELLAELARVLRYERVRRIHKLSDAEITAFVNSLESFATVVSLPEVLSRVVPHDRDDDVVVASAVAGRAEVICTRNRHLFHEDVIAYCRQHGIEVVNDLELLARLRETDDQSDLQG